MNTEKLSEIVDVLSNISVNFTEELKDFLAEKDKIIRDLNLENVKRFIFYFLNSFSYHHSETYCIEPINIIINFIETFEEYDFLDTFSMFLSKSSRSRNLFIEADGLQFLENVYQKGEITLDTYIICILNLTKLDDFVLYENRYYYKKVNDFFMNLDKNHDIFKTNIENMYKLLYGDLYSSTNRPFKIPYFYRFIDHSSINLDPFNAYILGKYVIDSFIKENNDIYSIPHIENIAHRYMSDFHFWNYLSNPQKFYEILNNAEKEILPLFQLYQGSYLIFNDILSSAIHFTFKVSRLNTEGSGFFSIDDVNYLFFYNDAMEICGERTQLLMDTWYEMTIHASTDKKETVSFIDNRIVLYVSKALINNIKLSSFFDGIVFLGSYIEIMEHGSDRIFKLGPYLNRTLHHNFKYSALYFVVPYFNVFSHFISVDNISFLIQEMEKTENFDKMKTLFDILIKSQEDFNMLETYHFENILSILEKWKNSSNKEVLYDMISKLINMSGKHHLFYNELFLEKEILDNIDGKTRKMLLNLKSSAEQPLIKSLIHHNKLFNKEISKNLEYVRKIDNFKHSDQSILLPIWMTTLPGPVVSYSCVISQTVDISPFLEYDVCNSSCLSLFSEFVSLLFGETTNEGYNCSLVLSDLKVPSVLFKYSSFFIILTSFNLIKDNELNSTEIYDQKLKKDLILRAITGIYANTFLFLNHVSLVVNNDNILYTKFYERDKDLILCLGSINLGCIELNIARNLENEFRLIFGKEISNGTFYIRHVEFIKKYVLYNENHKNMFDTYLSQSRYTYKCDIISDKFICQLANQDRMDDIYFTEGGLEVYIDNKKIHIKHPIVSSCSKSIRSISHSFEQNLICVDFHFGITMIFKPNIDKCLIGQQKWGRKSNSIINGSLLLCATCFDSMVILWHCVSGAITGKIILDSDTPITAGCFDEVYSLIYLATGNYFYIFTVNCVELKRLKTDKGISYIRVLNLRNHNSCCFVGFTNGDIDFMEFSDGDLIRSRVNSMHKAKIMRINIVHSEMLAIVRDSNHIQTLIHLNKVNSQDHSKKCYFCESNSKKICELCSRYICTKCRIKKSCIGCVGEKLYM